MEPTDQDIEQFIASVNKFSHYDFRDYSNKSLQRRLAKILSDYDLDITRLIERMQRESSFLEQVVKEITVSTTELFRDPEVWQALRWRILPRLKDRDPVKVWSVGCSTGLEVYSFMIIALETGIGDRVELIGTDLNTQTLQQAKQGIYSYRFNQNYLRNFDKVMRENPVNPEQSFHVPYTKYFHIDPVKDTLRAREFLTRRVTFRKYDLVTCIAPAPLTFDLILCRNVIIYFNYNLQNKVFSLFYDRLQEGGYLLLGQHESILETGQIKFIREGFFYRKSEQEPDRPY